MTAPPPETDGPLTVDDLEERLSRPNGGVRAVLGRLAGDLVVLGAGGKMGPSLARMARRALDELGGEHARRQVIAVSRFSDAAQQRALDGWGVRTITADLADPRALAALPDASLVVYMAGQKFGTADVPARMWGTNTFLPGRVAERFATSRIAAFSTGNVYPNTSAPGRGAAEDHVLTPIGEYANSCVGRERVLEYVCERQRTRLAIVRLSYAVDLRYGVVVDIAKRVRRNEPINVRTGWVNVIWQGDASAQALQSLARADTPPFIVNVTGPEALSVPDIAHRFGREFRRHPRFVGMTAPDALLSDTSLAQRLFGPPQVSAERLIGWVAAWLAANNPTLDKPTKFEVRDGRY